MPQAQISFNLDDMDDPLIPDGVPSFEGGQFSNQRANLLKPNQSKNLVNCDLDKLGRIVTRRGSIRLGAALPGGAYIQGLANFQTAGYNYLVGANGGRLYKFEGGVWSQIATGGIQDDDLITFVREGFISNADGYVVGDTVLSVGGFVGSVQNGQSFIFINSNKNDEFTYIVVDHHETGGNTISITIAAPGLVTRVYNLWGIIVLQTAQLDHSNGYPGGTTDINMDQYFGVVNTGERFIIQDENVLHTVTGHSEIGGNTTEITFSPPIQAEYVAADPIAPIVMAQGNDRLFWSDGIGNIFGWDGRHTTNLSDGNLIDAVRSIHGLGQPDDGLPPVGPRTLVWFQSRLIAAGMRDQPDVVYFSDFLDATRWNRNFQQLRVGGGESDPIIALLPWTDLNLLALKQNSNYVVNCDPSQNPTPDDITQLIASFAIKRIHGSIGCSAPLSAIQVGGGGGGYWSGSSGTWAAGSDVFFLDGQKKLRSIRRVLAAVGQQELGEPISFPVQDIFDRITPPYINRCVSGYHNDRYMIAMPIDGSTTPNIVMVYNLLTQSWCGQWNGWNPTCFSARTPTADFVKLCFGQSDGTVFEWLDDLSATDETDSTYQDNGVDYGTSVFSRALTGGDPFSPKTGLNVEFEFSESVADAIITIYLDGMAQIGVLTPHFSTLSGTPLVLPFMIPFSLPLPGLLRKSFDLQRYGQYRELQFRIDTTAKKLSLRSIRETCFMDSIILQTIP